MANIKQFGETHHVEFMKHSAGCSSLIEQPLDLAKGFWQWRSKLGIPPTTQIRDCDLPAWCKLVRQILINHKMDKASVKISIQNYFGRIPTLFPECFSPKIMSSGWERSGLRPFNPIKMLRSCCPQLHSIRDEKVCVEILETVMTEIANYHR